jgi:outer membrane receptor protein involved in Fe transport
MWHATEDLQLYAATSRGFRAGGLQPGFASPTTGQKAPTTFKADSLWSYELGERSNWLDNTLHFDVSAFLAKWTNPQTLQVVSGSSVPSSYLTNVGGVDSRGVEASLQYALPLPGLTFSSSAAYTRTITTKDFIGFDGSTVKPGTAWPFAPRWQTATTLSYATELGEWALGANATHLYIGKASNDLVKSANLGVFGYSQWNMQLSAARPSLTWLPELSFNVDNLTDKRGVANIYTGGAYTDVTYIRPRSLSLRLSGHF